MQIQDTKDIIKILPLDEGFRQKLLMDFDGLDPAIKDEMTDILWDAYDELYEMRLQGNLEEGVVKGAHGEEALDDTFYDRISDKTDHEMNNESAQRSQKVDLSSTRQALEELLKKDNKSSVN